MFEYLAFLYHVSIIIMGKALESSFVSYLKQTGENRVQ